MRRRSIRFVGPILYCLEGRSRDEGPRTTFNWLIRKTLNQYNISNDVPKVYFFFLENSSDPLQVWNGMPPWLTNRLHILHFDITEVYRSTDEHVIGSNRNFLIYSSVPCVHYCNPATTWCDSDTSNYLSLPIFANTFIINYSQVTLKYL